jgi:hypothetical protein
MSPVFEVFTMVKIHFEVFASHFSLKMEAAWFS